MCRILRSLARLSCLIMFASFCVNARPAAAENWALLIGIDRYDDSDQTSRLPALLGAVRDAESLSRTLTEAAGFPKANVVTLTNTKATRREILRAVERFKSQVKSGDTLFLFFAGHGCEDTDDGKMFMLTYDAAADSISLLKKTALDVADFTEPLRKVPARLMLIAFDMCRVEVGRAGTTGMTASAQTRGQDFSTSAKGKDAPLTDSPGVVLRWWSCSPTERSYEMTTKTGEKRGYFSYYLEEALRDRMILTDRSITNLASYVGPKVKAEVKRIEGKTQQPVLTFDGVKTLQELNTMYIGEAKKNQSTDLPLPAGFQKRIRQLIAIVASGDLYLRTLDKDKILIDFDVPLFRPVRAILSHTDQKKIVGLESYMERTWEHRDGDNAKKVFSLLKEGIKTALSDDNRNRDTDDVYLSSDWRFSEDVIIENGLAGTVFVANNAAHESQESSGLIVLKLGLFRSNNIPSGDLGLRQDTSPYRIVLFVEKKNRP